MRRANIAATRTGAVVVVMTAATCAGASASASASARTIIVVETSGVAESICWVSAATTTVC